MSLLGLPLKQRFCPLYLQKVKMCKKFVTFILEI